MKRKPKRRVNMKALPRLLFFHKNSSIEIRRNSIIITGNKIDAAIAFSESLLKEDWADKFNSKKNYMNIILATHDTEYGYRIEILDPYALEAEKWEEFKKNVEKICNNLIVFS